MIDVEKEEIQHYFPWKFWKKEELVNFIIVNTSMSQNGCSFRVLELAKS